MLSSIFEEGIPSFHSAVRFVLLSSSVLSIGKLVTGSIVFSEREGSIWMRDSAVEVSDLIYRRNIEHVNGISPLLDRITPKFTAFCRIYACISVQKVALLLLFRF